ncbi:CG0192-related protein [Kineococcus rubinsiae]|uniref:CG0192-related protein n=1 Tax=Kineococcus rubinsiae TaxID=2609562 RepID=UPI001430468A|nr:hypothetical protein [Kineococcus rubinsiae]NIZ92612.1 hypothetical protein [Kineococcus rubinsiae]
MALIHRAEIRPTKLELLEAWLPGRPWSPAGSGEARQEVRALRKVASARFDDPAGEVGVELMVVRAGGDGPLLHVPLTYRAAPLAGAEHALVGTMEHSVLGLRHVYDGCADPVFVAALARTVLTGGRQADEVVEGDPGPRAPDVVLAGSGRPGEPVPDLAPVRVVADGDPAVVTAGSLVVEVLRVLGPAGARAGGEGATLHATWAAHPEPVLLARVRTA